MTTIPKPSGKVRWIVCGLLFAAVVLSYIDRLVLPTLKPDLQARYGWSESGYADLAIWFQAGYGIAYVAFGRLIDRIGARAGYALAVGLWTVGHVMHIFFTSTAGMLFARKKIGNITLWAAYREENDRRIVSDIYKYRMEVQE